MKWYNNFLRSSVVEEMKPRVRKLILVASVLVVALLLIVRTWRTRESFKGSKYKSGNPPKSIGYKPSPEEKAQRKVRRALRQKFVLTRKPDDFAAWMNSVPENLREAAAKKQKWRDSGKSKDSKEWMDYQKAVPYDVKRWRKARDRLVRKQTAWGPQFDPHAKGTVDLPFPIDVSVKTIKGEKKFTVPTIKWLNPQLRKAVFESPQFRKIEKMMIDNHERLRQAGYTSPTDYYLKNPSEAKYAIVQRQNPTRAAFLPSEIPWGA